MLRKGRAEKRRLLQRSLSFCHHLLASAGKKRNRRYEETRHSKRAATYKIPEAAAVVHAGAMKAFEPPVAEFVCWELILHKNKLTNALSFEPCGHKSPARLGANQKVDPPSHVIATHFNA